MSTFCWIACVIVSGVVCPGTCTVTAPHDTDPRNGSPIRFQPALRARLYGWVVGAAVPAFVIVAALLSRMK